VVRTARLLVRGHRIERLARRSQHEQAAHAKRDQDCSTSEPQRPNQWPDERRDPESGQCSDQRVDEIRRGRAGAGREAGA
jgi:hypothetical protein